MLDDFIDMMAGPTTFRKLRYLRTERSMSSRIATRSLLRSRGISYFGVRSKIVERRYRSNCRLHPQVEYYPTKFRARLKVVEKFSRKVK